MDERDPRAHLRALLHHQGAGQGAPAWAWPRSTASSSRAAATSGCTAGCTTGSTFTVYLPRGRRDRASASRSRRRWTDQPRAASTVLVVEDELAVRRLASRVLRARGYRVLEASDGAEALQLMDRLGGRLDLVLTDVVMPGLSGPALVERLLPGAPELKVLYITGYSEEAIRQHGAAAGGRRAPREAVHRPPAGRAGPRAPSPGRRPRCSAFRPPRPRERSTSRGMPPGAAARSSARRSRCWSGPATRSCCRRPSSTRTPSSAPEAPAWPSGCSASPIATAGSSRFATISPPASPASRRRRSPARRLPLRLSYSGRVYRQEPERGGRPRETLQVGAELLGDGSLEADVEVVRLTIELIRSAGLRTSR